MRFDRGDKKQQQRWSDLPHGEFARQGLMIGDLDQPQVDAFLAVMQATLSPAGYDRIMALWAADDVLATTAGGGSTEGGGPPGGKPAGEEEDEDRGGPPPWAGKEDDEASAGPNAGGPEGGGGPNDSEPGGGKPDGASYGKRYYWLAIIGEPSGNEWWQWQFGGHNVTVNATIKGENVSLTPSFLGAQPATYPRDDTTVRPLGDLADEAFALVTSLDEAARNRAVRGSTPIGLVLGPGRDCKTVPAEGLPASAMTPGQQAALLKLTDKYSGLAHDTAAAARAEQIRDGLAETYFAWYGPTTAGSAGYFRVTGPRILIEYSPQLSAGQPANHVRGVYRDPANDYGGTVCSK